MPDARRRLVAALVAVAVIAVLVVVALGTSGGEDGDSLRVERSQTEVLVYVDDPGDNVAARADGARTVLVECVDRDDRVLVRARQAWPFADTDNGTLDPHAHLPLDAAGLRQLTSCRVAGTDPVLEGGTL